ncbi:L10-interacting MYB domain-containing protein [Bienertia sinuspersici]
MASNNQRDYDEGEGSMRDTLHIFCDLCIQYAERSKGKRSATTSQRMPWKVLEVEFTKRTNLAYDKNQLKNKWDWMRNRWRLWRALKGKENN